MAPRRVDVGRPREAIVALERLDRDSASMGVWRHYWELLADALDGVLRAI